MAVGQVAAVRQVHAEHSVARLHDGEVDGHVRLRARVRLHVGVIGAEELFGARDGERLRDVDELAAAVVPLAWIAFGVLVRQYRAGRFENRAADEILRRDELEPFRLTGGFVRDGRGDIGIDLAQRTLHS
jgi:hypothetical protein